MRAPKELHEFHRQKMRQKEAESRSDNGDEPKRTDYLDYLEEMSTVSSMSSESSMSSVSTDVIRKSKMSSTGHQDVIKCHQVSSMSSGRNITEEVRIWIDECPGRFSVADLDRDIGLKTRVDKVSRAKAIERLIKNGVIERYGSIRGQYQIVDTDCPDIDFINVDCTRFYIDLPFNLANLYLIQPGNILIISGDSNAGKTAFLIYTLYKTINLYNNNKTKLHKREIHYFSSEMGPAEWHNRFVKTQIPLEWWSSNCNFKKRSENFHQVVDPNGLNFIDYLEIHKDFYEVGGLIRQIHDKLVDGLAIISLQKNVGSEFGVGGNRGVEKARIYLTIREAINKGGMGDWATAKIVKGKNAIGKNHNKCETDFRIVDAWKLMQETAWERRD